MRSRVMIALGLSLFAVVVTACKTTESRVRDDVYTLPERKVDFIAEDQRQVLTVEYEFVNVRGSVAGMMEYFDSSGQRSALEATGCRVQVGSAYDPRNGDKRLFVKVIVYGDDGTNSASAETIAYLPPAHFPPRTSTMPYAFDELLTSDYNEQRYVRISSGAELAIRSSHLESVSGQSPRYRNFLALFEFDPAFSQIGPLSFDFSLGPGDAGLMRVRCENFAFRRL